MRCVVFDWCYHFCNKFARWPQKMIACDAIWCVGTVDAIIFCNKFARWLQKMIACDAIWCVGTSPRNPRFPIVHFVIQSAFRARMSIFKSGISGSECECPYWQVIVCLQQASVPKFYAPKRRFWKAERNVRWAFSKHFPRVWVLDLGW